MSELPSEPNLQERLSQLFGSYKAEWLREHIFDLFTEPAYFPELTTARPCVLLGGRGTGKTTVLRGLSYEGQFALTGRDRSKIADWPFYGLYYKVNTNRVTALRGAELTETQWIKVFAHYFNLLCSDLIVRFLQWYRLQTPADVIIPIESCQLISRSLNVEPAQNLRDLGARIKAALVDFEAFVNNIADDTKTLAMSMQGAPIDTLLEALSEHRHFSGKQFFFLIDEYENFEDYQQQVVNTLIKHSGKMYTFKVGIRELGWRRRTTLNENEQLISPADYVRINIAEKLDRDRFAAFATAVCNERLAKLSTDSARQLPDISSVFIGLTEEEEALKLGVREKMAEFLLELHDAGVESATIEAASQLPPLEAYLIQAWAQASQHSAASELADYWGNLSAWKTRYSNYNHSLLYTLKRGKRGIRKYYCGWTVLLQLAAGNIRYILELVDNALLLHLRDGGQMGGEVSPETQTIAAQQVGRKNLAELEGLSVHGAQLTKLLLGLGRIFQIMAGDAIGHTPELNQFHLESTSPGCSEVTSEEQTRALQLLDSAVMHLALVRSRGNKPTDETDTREYDYMVHPIYSAFFVFSYRKKRKMLLSERELLRIIQSPKEAIRAILERQHRRDDEDLPQQTLPFAAYYSGDSQ